jgi:ribonuclease-3
MGETEKLETLESGIGYHFKDQSLLDTALKHSSYVHEAGVDTEETQPAEDYQRLEFLGDSVLSLCVSTRLYQVFPGVSEGELSKMRAGLVNDTRLAKTAREIGVAPCLYLGRGEEATGGRDKNSILADALEAILGAVYLDGGIRPVQDVVDTLLGDLIERSSTHDLLKDYKTRLQELSQERYNQNPVYRLTGTSGPDHSRTFEVTLSLDGEELSRGFGRSKKEAEMSAAKTALEILTG